MVASDSFTATPKVSLTFFQAGYCTHPLGMVLQGESWHSATFPATFALIEHPTQGKILYDTGYSHRFFEETRPWPMRLYAWTTPVHLEDGESAVAQLRSQHISPTDIQTIIISHFHGDHIGGLRDFPSATFICLRSAYEAVKDRRGIQALRAGFLSGLLPADFEQRTRFVDHSPQVSLPDQYRPFDTGLDLFGDGSLLGVALAGHATGQLGLLLHDQTGQDYFLIADACWLRQAYESLVMPHPLTALIQADALAYRETLHKLHQLHQHYPALRIVPAHCARTWKQLPKAMP